MKSVYGGRICVPPMPMVYGEEPMPRKTRKKRAAEGPALPSQDTGHFILLAWVDAVAAAGQITDAAKITLPVQFTVGMLRHSDGDKTVLAGSYCDDDDADQFGESTTIPTSLIRRAWVPTGWREVDLSDQRESG